VTSTALVTLNLAPVLSNLVPITLSNAFYLGEVISLGTPGGLPPDNPSKAIAGFVESVTITHIVMRDFKRKQIWITHDNFSKYIVSNWSRRPGRMVRINYTVSSRVEDVSKVKHLADFCRKWMDANEKIDTTGYRKAVIVDVKNGLQIEAIFYPLPGLDSHPIRQAFILALASAAKRLGLPPVPTGLMTEFPEDKDKVSYTEGQLEDLVTQNDGKDGGAGKAVRGNDGGAGKAAVLVALDRDDGDGGDHDAIVDDFVYNGGAGDGDGGDD